MERYRSAARWGWERAGLVGLTVGLLALAMAPVGARGQRPDTAMPKGVQLKLTYETRYRPRLAVPAFTGADAVAVAEDVHRIVERDLDYSDRFQMMFTIPERLQENPGNYGAWNSLNVVYLVTGSIERGEGGVWGLRLALHDVVYGAVKELRLFQLPPVDDPGFRMAVHAVSDEVVRWATGEAGMAASRIALTYQLRDQTYELLLVDSDGENVQRLQSASMLYSPAWSPDGSRLAYSAGDYTGRYRIVERNLTTGATRTITERGNLAQTPSYSPDGTHLAMALWLDRGMEIQDYDLQRNCCLRRLSRRSSIDMHPSYSPDGRQMVFQSDRLGAPHIFTMPADGGDAVLITPFERGGPGFYTSAEWSPKNSQLVFQGRSRGGVNQVMVADARRPGGPVQQITSEGRSEDPSWAPDGRHIVFSGVREDGMGLYVIDLTTGRIRPLVTGGRYRMPSWSPVLRQASALTAGQ